MFLSNIFSLSNFNLSGGLIFSDTQNIKVGLSQKVHTFNLATAFKKMNPNHSFSFSYFRLQTKP